MSPAKNILVQTEFKIVSIYVSRFFFLLQESKGIAPVHFDVGSWYGMKEKKRHSDFLFPFNNMNVR